MNDERTGKMAANHAARHHPGHLSWPLVFFNKYLWHMDYFSLSQILLLGESATHPIEESRVHARCMSALW